MNLNYIINNTLSSDIAIDPGTQMTLIAVRDKGIVLNEPSYIAYDVNTKEVQAVGNEAKEMLGKAPSCIKIVQPIASGVISDYEMAIKMFRRFFSMVYKKTILKPRIISSIPSQSTEIEQKALADALREAGAREVYLVEEPLAAAAGAGCDLSLARGMLIADIGAGRCDVASISLGRSVISKSIPNAGDLFTDEIIKYIRKNHNLNVGYLTADSLKNEIGCAYPFDLSKTAEISGCDITSGMPRKISINSEEIRELLYPQFKKIAHTIRTTLEETPPELQSDILEDGILITGGSAMLWGMEKWLSMELGIKVFVTQNMDECVIKGLLEQLEKLDTTGMSADKYYYSV